MAWIWHMCFVNMKQRGIRTWLTILGVIIGVISIVSMLSIGIGVKKEMMSEFESYGSLTEITISGITEGKRKDKMITDRKLLEVADLEYVDTVYPQLNISTIMQYEHFTGWVEITGAPTEYLRKLTFDKGGMPEVSGMKPELIFGENAMDMFYNENTGASFGEVHEEEETDLTGKSMDVQFGWEENAPTYHLSVAGMAERQYYRTFCNIEVLKKYLKQISQDGVITGQPVDENGEGYREWIYDTAVVEVDDVSHVEKVIKELQNMGYQTENNKELLDSVNKQLKIIQLLLGGIGMIALVVAVIGIGNTMTTSVYERVHDIGILKVLGCDTDDLLYLFFLESGILGGVGGLIGILVSYLTAIFGINKLGVKLLEMPKGTELAVIPWWLAVAAVLFAIVLGILAGYFPARWAAKLKPIKAIGK